ncbi:MAG: AraC family transcriptional regulator [Clostridium sp.]|nr:AraC family transcriptional regulator [Clostridium sp.]
MKNISTIEFHTGTKEELLPDFSPDFPYIATRAQLDKYRERFVPWHWHKTVELFYMESGGIEYFTPGGRTVFPEGSGGMVNSNVLHMTKPLKDHEENSQIHHIFDPSFIAGEHGSRIEEKYITPLISSPQIEIIPLYPDDPEQALILDAVRRSFCLREEEFGYEIKLRAALSDIWLRLLALSHPLPEEKGRAGKAGDKIKSMLIYIHEHYGEKIRISHLSEAAYSSERECFRAFQDSLHMTPVEYIQNYRIQMACRLLAETDQAVTSICHACGLGSSSYFGKIFREHTGCTPVEYRRKWQNRDRKGQK